MRRFLSLKGVLKRTLEGCGVYAARGHDCLDAGDRINQDEYRTYSGGNVRN